MVPVKRLFLVAGFEGATLEKVVRDVERRFEAGSHRFIVRPYPVKSDKRALYLKALAREAITFIFGGNGSTNFCRRLDQPCAMDQDKGKAKAKTCKAGREQQLACARARPQMLIVICADRIFDDVFERFGRGALIVHLDGPGLPDADELKRLIDEFEPIATDVLSTVANRSKSFYAPLIPYHNFQRMAGLTIAADAQAAPATFREIMQRYHHALYKADFQNPRKKVRGAYMLDAETAFQQDYLHKTVQTIGPESLEDGFHLLNAYHTYGAKADPGFHFDIMNRAGGGLGHVFTDVVTGKKSGPKDTHVNVTPCDRKL
jgi:hypothetical protein